MTDEDQLERAPDSDPEQDRSLAPRQWPRLLGRVLVLYVASRLVTLVGAGMAMLTIPGLTLPAVLTMWDGSWYIRLIREGYPDQVPEVGGKLVQNTGGFFPLYALVVRGADVLLPGGDYIAAVAVAVIFGAVATVLVALLAQALAGREAAERTAALFCFFPGAIVFSLAYTESLMLAAAAACLLLLYKRQWLAAGVAAALASAVRPTGIVLVASCAWAAFLAIRQRREWGALVAPALAPLGLLAFFTFLQFRTGDFGFWLRSGREAWMDKTDFGANTLDVAVNFVTGPLDHPDEFLLGLCMIFTIFALVCLVRARLPAFVNIFTAGMLLLPMSSAVLNLRPRFVLSAFPLFIALGMKVRGTAFVALLATSAALVPLLVVYYTRGVVVPWFAP